MQFIKTTERMLHKCAHPVIISFSVVGKGWRRKRRQPFTFCWCLRTLWVKCCLLAATIGISIFPITFLHKKFKGLPSIPSSTFPTSLYLGNGLESKFYNVYNVRIMTFFTPNSSAVAIFLTRSLQLAFQSSFILDSDSLNVSDDFMPIFIGFQLSPISFGFSVWDMLQKLK